MDGYCIEGNEQWHGGQVAAVCCVDEGMYSLVGWDFGEEKIVGHLWDI